MPFANLELTLASQYLDFRPLGCDTLKMEAVTCSETSVPVYQITEHDISEDGDLSIPLEITLENRNLNNLIELIGF